MGSPQGSAVATITRADNQIFIFINRSLVYSKITDFNPTFNDAVDFSHFVNPGQNTVVVVGIDWGQIMDFQVSLQLPGVPKPVIFSTNGAQPSQAGKTFTGNYTFTYQA